jgi:hypothetical protein
MIPYSNITSVVDCEYSNITYTTEEGQALQRNIMLSINHNSTLYKQNHFSHKGKKKYYILVIYYNS